MLQPARGIIKAEDVKTLVLLMKARNRRLSQVMLRAKMIEIEKGD
jgi:hypothetical protein